MKKPKHTSTKTSKTIAQSAAYDLWKAPTFCVEDFADNPDAFLSRVAEEISMGVSALNKSGEDQGVRGIKFNIRWTNIRHAEHNPDGNIGAFHITAIGERV